MVLKKGLSLNGPILTFDDKARHEYLTGFSKRKQERRRHGLALQQLKERKLRLEKRQKLREDKKNDLKKVKAWELIDDRRKINAKKVEEIEFQDGFTQRNFGDAVMVTTFSGIPGSTTEEAFNDEIEINIEQEDEDLEESEEEEKNGSKAKKFNKNKSKEDHDYLQQKAGSLEEFKRKIGNNLPPVKKKQKERQLKQQKKASFSDKSKLKKSTKKIIKIEKKKRLLNPKTKKK